MGTNKKKQFIVMVVLIPIFKKCDSDFTITLIYE